MSTDYVGSVWELDADTLTDPAAVRDLVEELCAKGGDHVCLACDLADGLYWHCADYHEGQGSERYSILSTLDYSPGMSERSPEEGEEEREAARYVYELLAQGA